MRFFQRRACCRIKSSKHLFEVLRLNAETFRIAFGRLPKLSRQSMQLASRGSSTDPPKLGGPKSCSNEGLKNSALPAESGSGRGTLAKKPGNPAESTRWCHTRNHS